MPSSTIAIATLLFCKAYSNTECEQCKTIIPKAELIVIFRQSMGKEVSNVYLHLGCVPAYGQQLIGREEAETVSELPNLLEVGLSS